MSGLNPRNPLWVLLTLALLAGAQAALAKKPSQRMSDDERGEMLYGRHCTQCHGPTAAGNGLATKSLVAPVPDLRGQLNKDNREDYAQLVLRGAGPMPGFASSFDRYDARRIMRWMQKIGPADAPDWPPEPEPETGVEVKVASPPGELDGPKPSALRPAEPAPKEDPSEPEAGE